LADIMNKQTKWKWMLRENHSIPYYQEQTCTTTFGGFFT